MRQALGVFLVVLAAAAVVQSIREFAIWEVGDGRYAEETEALPWGEPIEFAGHRFTVRDDLPYDSTYSEQAFTGTIQPLVDGRPLGAPSRAGVRPGRRLDDLGRYHLWYDARVFRDRETDARELWLARRIQEQGGPRMYEVVVVDEDGRMRRALYHAGQLGSDYRLYRATQLVRNSEWSFWTVYPLSVLELAIFPPLLLIFPILPFVAGVALIRRDRSRGVR